MSEIDRIVRMLTKTFDKGAWHGPTVREVLQNVKATHAHDRAGASHSIAELVLHMASWRQFAIRRLLGDGAYEVSPEMNFPSVANRSWEEAKEQLEESQRELIKAARAFPEDRLGELVPSSSYKYTYYTLLHGIMHHDLYHIGQIQLILKANESKP